MTRSRAGLDIVIRGWDLPGWEDNFYPEGLPPDWRLTYFSSAFSAVLLDAAVWTQADAATLRTWAGDVHTGFRFYLELPVPGVPVGVITGTAAALDGRVAGLLGSSDAEPKPICPYYRWCDRASETAPGSHGLARAVDAQDLDLRSARVWMESFVEDLDGASGLVVLEGRGLGDDTLRQWLELAWLLGACPT